MSRPELAPRLERLRAVATTALAGRPPAHDLAHVLRVVASARRIALAEGADVDVVLAAALLHELVNLPKHHPDSARSGDLCAIEAGRVLVEVAWPSELIEPVVASIRDHAFSKGAAPTTLEARVLQDADRLDAIGAIGVARTFATATEMRAAFYDPADPFARSGRALDDKRFAVDHFYRKLLRIEATLHTPSARAIARKRSAFLDAFLDQLADEI